VKDERRVRYVGYCPNDGEVVHEFPEWGAITETCNRDCPGAFCAGLALPLMLTFTRAPITVEIVNDVRIVCVG